MEFRGQFTESANATTASRFPHIGRSRILSNSVIPIDQLSAAHELSYRFYHGSLRNRSTLAREPAQFRESLPISLVTEP